MSTLSRSIGRTHQLLFIFLQCGISIHQTSAQPLTSTHLTGAEGRSVESRSDSQVDSPDESNLPLQIAGIVGSWIIFDAIVVFLLLLVGKRLRRSVQASNRSLEMVMLKREYPNVSVDPSPDTYYATSGFPSPNFSRKMSWSNVPRGGVSGPSGHPLQHAHGSNPSVSTIDESVVSADKRRAQEQMEFLYAAVMDQEAKKMSATCEPISEDSDYSPQTPSSSSLKSPLTGKFAHPLSPRLQTQAPPPPPKPSSPKSSRLSKISNLSIFSPGRSSGLTNKLKSPKSATIRSMQISPPLSSPDSGSNNPPHTSNNPYYHYMASNNPASPPLSPRQYNPGPPPAAPSGEPTSSRMTPQYKPVTMQPIYPPPSFNEANADSNVAIGTATTTSTRAPAPTPLNLALLNSKPNPVVNTSGALPFRQMNTSGHDVYGNVPMSAPPTKTTVLERPAHNQGGPRTGMPTPYSPYMPFTPLTPMTPSRLVTKKERKKQEKVNGLRVLAEDDMVASDEDMWGM